MGLLIVILKKKHAIYVVDKHRYSIDEFHDDL
jgi:hypothetical protein